jgi:hypothetical protein
MIIYGKMIMLIEIELLKRSNDFINNLNIYEKFVNISKNTIYINDIIFEDINFTVIYNSG